VAARLPWFRAYCEARTDKKLGKLEDDEHRVWFHLLCYAAENDVRGMIDMTDRELVALECAKDDMELLDRTVAKLTRLKIVAQEDPFIYFVKFAERQYDNPSSRPEAVKERVRKHREQKTPPSSGKGSSVSRPASP